MTTADRILDATLDCIREVGLRRLTLEDVAQAAGTSRQTVYRHFGSRDRLLESVILREEDQLLREVEQAVADAPTLQDAIEAAVRVVLMAARSHPLLDRLLAEEPGALLPYLALGRGPVVSAALPVVRRLLARFLPGADARRLDMLAKAVTRLMVSYALAPEGSAEETAEMLGALLTHGVADQAPDGVTDVRPTARG